MELFDLYNLEYTWTAVVRLNNNKVISIWWTALYGLGNSIKEVISVSSDLPKYKISESKFLS
jgi:hypothetical protein